MPSQREIAYHEAGHAVIALGFGEWSVAQRSSLAQAVEVRLRSAVANAAKRRCITLAGPLAQRRFAPRSNWLTGDFAIAEKMIFGKGSSGTAAVKNI